MSFVQQLNLSKDGLANSAQFLCDTNNKIVVNTVLSASDLESSSGSLNTLFSSVQNFKDDYQSSMTAINSRFDGDEATLATKATQVELEARSNALSDRIDLKASQVEMDSKFQGASDAVDVKINGVKDASEARCNALSGRIDDVVSKEAADVASISSNFAALQRITETIRADLDRLAVSYSSLTGLPFVSPTVDGKGGDVPLS